MKKKYTIPQTIVVVAEAECILAESGGGTGYTQRKNEGLHTDGKYVTIENAKEDQTFIKGQGENGAGNRSKGGSLWDDWE